MFKKSLPVGMIFIFLLVALATMGLAYGAWTETLTVNGTAQTGTMDVVFEIASLNEYNANDPLGTENLGTCEMALSNNNHNLTITVKNAYPGYSCEAGALYKNTGSIPAKIVSVEEVSNNVPFSGLMTIVPPSSGVIPAGQWSDGGPWFTFAIPKGETGHEGETYTFSYKIIAEQATP